MSKETPEPEVEYEVVMDEPDDATPCRCQSCDWTGVYADVASIDFACLTPGDPSPAGRCPHCDGLVYVVKERKAVWVVIYTHKYGTDVWVRETKPTVDDEIALLIDWEGEEQGDYLEINGPHYIGGDL